ncbi:hypothetical protein KAI87_09440 [Myxococcota bacterium]|nr:hypothetical protein [Myxococcota bacterium]
MIQARFLAPIFFSYWRLARVQIPGFVVAVFLVLGSLISSGIASATTVRWLSETEMTRSSTHIVRGVVQKIEVVDRPGGRLITEVTLSVERLIKGKAQDSKELVFVLPGGEKNGITMGVSGVSHYSKGERVLLFLEQTSKSLVEIGVGAGKFRVFEKDGVARIQRELGHRNFQKATEQGPLLSDLLKTKVELLSIFETRISLLVLL